jgi:hypothetical protein
LTTSGGGLPHATVADASPQEITAAAARLLAGSSPRDWLSPTNRYRRNAIDRLLADHQGNRLRSAQLAEYIAASAPLHCCDGWSFLGRALLCHLHGDPDGARHLAYYAELRAAASLLATGGIGLFKYDHFVIDKQPKAKLLMHCSTHQAAWTMLDQWAALPTSGDLLREIIEPEPSHSMGEWISALPRSMAWQPIATSWLRSLGLDLKRLSEDGTARNESGYRPTRLSIPTQLPSGEAVRFACELWELLEPFQSLPFNSIDRHFLRLTIDSALPTTAVPKSQWVSSIAGIVNKIAPVDGPRWINFLTRQEESKDPSVISMARLGHLSPSVTSADIVLSSDHHLSVMARACLLLRIASGATQRMLFSASLNTSALEDWWQGFGFSRGLWDVAPVATDLMNLYEDVRVAKDDLDQCATSGAGNYWELVAGAPQSFARLGSMEMVGIWSIVR